MILSLENYKLLPMVSCVQNVRLHSMSSHFFSFPCSSQENWPNNRLTSDLPLCTLPHNQCNVFNHVRLSVHRGSHVTISHDALDLTWSAPACPPPDMRPNCTWASGNDIWWLRLETCSTVYTWGPPVITSWGQDWRPILICSLEDPSLPVLTSGGYWSTHDGQAGGAHLTGMISC